MAQTTLREYLQLTEDAINSGRVNEAFTNCQQVLAQFPELLEARRLLGEVYLKQGQLEEAQQTFDWVLTNDPENVVTYCSRALICEQLKDYDTALDCYQQAYELSRGISHIRQEFNQLSERVGQPGFIFSRAGLARLYMRGDLLPQAVQEWENVLASSPDRLDARTGLLETYWRESMYDRVEQLARQILNTVPHCLKALVLLAHVTFAQNALQARELMQQAKALDPDLVIARELFSDFMVSNPKDPFLPLLKQPPAVISGAAKQPEPVVVQPAPPSAATNGSTFSDPLGRWSSLDNIIEPQQDYQSLQEVPPLGNWGSNAPTNLGLWGSYTQTTDNLGHTAAPAETGSAQPEDHALSDSSEQQPPMAADVKSNGQERPWYHMDQLPSPADTMFEGTPADSWESILPPMEGSSITSSWEMEGQNSDIPAPPAWLDMLTRGERRQPAENLASKIESAPQPAAEASQVAPAADDQPLPAAAREPEAEQAVADQAPWIKPEVQVTPVLPPTSDEEEEEGFFFGPEWLKSLGAAALEGPASAAQEAPLPETTSPAAEQEAPEEAAAPLAADEQLEPEQQQPADPQPSPQPELSTSSWLDQAAQKFSAPEQKSAHNIRGPGKRSAFKRLYALRAGSTHQSGPASGRGNPHSHLPSRSLVTSESRLRPPRKLSSLKSRTARPNRCGPVHWRHSHRSQPKQLKRRRHPSITSTRCHSYLPYPRLQSLMARRRTLRKRIMPPVPPGQPARQPIR